MYSSNAHSCTNNTVVAGYHDSRRNTDTPYRSLWRCICSSCARAGVFPGIPACTGLPVCPVYRFFLVLPLQAGKSGHRLYNYSFCRFFYRDKFVFEVMTPYITKKKQGLPQVFGNPRTAFLNVLSLSSSECNLSRYFTPYEDQYHSQLYSKSLVFKKTDKLGQWRLLFTARPREPFFQLPASSPNSSGRRLL